MEAVQEELKEVKELSEYNYDKICEFFEEYEESKRAGKKKTCLLNTDAKYIIRYAFDGKKGTKINRNFIQFMLREILPERTEGENEEIDIFNECGLKLHICLPEDDPQMFRLGWQIAVDILTQYNAANFKFIKRGKLMSSEEGQEGKDITVYVDGDNRNIKDTETKRGWEFIINEINKALLYANVPPGKKPPGTLEKPEKYIANCEYISYRYEKDTPLHDPLERIIVKSNQEIMWEHNVMPLEDINTNDDNQQSTFRCCCK